MSVTLAAGGHFGLSEQRSGAAHADRLPHLLLMIDRWESRDAYNTFLSEHNDEYMRRSDESRFHYVQELRFGTFENVWTAG